MNDERKKILRSRNRLLFIVIILISIAEIFLNTYIFLYQAGHPGVLIALIIICLLAIAGLSYLYRNDNQIVFLYFAGLSLVIAVFSYNLLDLHIINLFFMFAPMIIISICQQIKPTLLVIALTCLSFFYLGYYKPVIFPDNWITSDIYYIIACVLGIGAVSVANIYYFNKILDESDRRQLKLEDLNKKNEQVLVGTRNSIVATNEFSKTLNYQVEETEISSETVVSAVEQMRDAMSHQNESVYQIHLKIEEFLKILDYVDNTVEKTTETSEDTNISVATLKEIVTEVRNSMDITVKSIEETYDTVEKLINHSEQIGVINQAIAEIADQTNLLSLNASIEAARAGEHGKGFSVVANEIKKLAKQASNNATTVSDILKRIEKETKQAGKTASETKNVVLDSQGKADKMVLVFDEMTEKNEKLDTLSQEAKQKVHQLQASSKEMAQEISNVSAISEENESSVEEVLAQVSNMKKLVGQNKNGFDRLHEHMKELENTNDI